MIRYLKGLLVSFTLLVSLSCEQPQDPVIAAVNEINETLKKHDWKLVQFTIEVNDEDIPPPLLFNSSDSLILKGRYDLNDMILEREEMLEIAEMPGKLNTFMQ